LRLRHAKVTKVKRQYYLVPDGKVGEHPFTLLREGMVQDNRYAVAKVVMFGREQLVLLRPVGNLLAMFVLDSFQVRPYTEFEDLVPKTDVDPEELAEAKTLIEETAKKHFDLAAYKDRSTEQLKQLVEAKIAGKEIVAAPPAQEHAQVISLMDALKRSVAEIRGETKQPQEAERPPKKLAPSTQEPKAAAKKPKRKSS
jgi:DNA end-binding protein Ku